MFLFDWLLIRRTHGLCSARGTRLTPSATLSSVDELIDSPDVNLFLAFASLDDVV
jgi:hypothetical protein